MQFISELSSVLINRYVYECKYKYAPPSNFWQRISHTFEMSFLPVSVTRHFFGRTLVPVWNTSLSTAGT